MARKRFLLRIDLKLYEVLERWAADEFRSVNGHIEYLLREAAVRAGRMGARRTDAGGGDAGTSSMDPTQSDREPS